MLFLKNDPGVLIPACLPGRQVSRDRGKKLVLMFFTLKRNQGPVD
jgi:hypothetical protein